MIKFELKNVNPLSYSWLRSLWANPLLTRFAKELLILKLLCFIHTPVIAQEKAQHTPAKSEYNTNIKTKDNISYFFNFEAEAINIFLIPDLYSPSVLPSTGRNATNNILIHEVCKEISGIFKDASQQIKHFEGHGRRVLKYRYWC